ncbi:predicted protein [Naegleria gruberi]|uniref:Predicted protein n=1 Tax=Naegleria gruberi TaxID=5762 RepID=D2W2X0_NAEGR|nr:uncharacterized protein NAEGRDRAFT_82182 [Naegleria gruberi]EFC36589.1 predicted protein [Naegleria gruberi]|eukprot:XP_002669333.1 predicted protein [Naegleria gruberi strain NEG-M]
MNRISEPNHTLHNTWTLWYHSPRSKINEQNYKAFFTKVKAFTTIEDFWRLFNNVRSPSCLPIGTTYYLMKDAIKPEWEDPNCINGGEMVFSFAKKSRQEADQWWLFSCIMCIGENFIGLGDHICGCTVANRKSMIRISFWLDTDEDEYVKRLEDQCKGAFDILSAGSTLFKFDFRSFRANLSKISKADD